MSVRRLLAQAGQARPERRQRSRRNSTELNSRHRPLSACFATATRNSSMDDRSTAEPRATHDAALTAFNTLRSYLASHILGQERLVERLLIALLADCHLLVEGPPGLATTPATQDPAPGP